MLNNFPLVPNPVTGMVEEENGHTSVSSGPTILGDIRGRTTEVRSVKHPSNAKISSDNQHSLFEAREAPSLQQGTARERG